MAARQPEAELCSYMKIVHRQGYHDDWYENSRYGLTIFLFMMYLSRIITLWEVYNFVDRQLALAGRGKSLSVWTESQAHWFGVAPDLLNHIP